MNVLSKPKETLTISRQRSVLLSHEDSITRWSQAIRAVDKKKSNKSSSSKDIHAVKDMIKDKPVAKIIMFSFLFLGVLFVFYVIVCMKD